jgi:hypothetical protein
MDMLRLDLEALEVEQLDVGAIGLDGGLASFGMGHGATELAHSCEPCGPCFCQCGCECFSCT